MNCPLRVFTQNAILINTHDASVIFKWAIKTNSKLKSCCGMKMCNKLCDSIQNKIKQK